MPGLKPLLSSALDLIFPPQFLDSGVGAQSGGLSPSVWASVAFTEPPLCDGCGIAFEYDIRSRCAACLAKPRAFDRARAACLYDDASRELILQFKHADRTDLAPLFCAWISRAAPDLLASAQAVVPVPLHRGRLFRRRYNQAAEIARPLARRHGLVYLPDVLLRTRAGESQGGKSGGARRRNVAGLFAVADGAQAKVAGKRVLVIDDVMTTGATGEACARALRVAGAAAVDFAVVARVKEAANLSI